MHIYSESIYFLKEIHQVVSLGEHREQKQLPSSAKNHIYCTNPIKTLIKIRMKEPFQ